MGCLKERGSSPPPFVNMGNVFFSCIIFIIYCIFPFFRAVFRRVIPGFFLLREASFLETFYNRHTIAQKNHPFCCVNMHEVQKKNIYSLSVDKPKVKMYNPLHIKEYS